LEEALDLSSDRILNEWMKNLYLCGPTDGTTGQEVHPSRFHKPAALKAATGVYCPASVGEVAALGRAYTHR